MRRRIREKPIKEPDARRRADYLKDSLFCVLLILQKIYRERVINMEVRNEWVNCPVCGNKTRNRIRDDTVLMRFPLFFPKCKNETLVDIEKFKMKVILEPDAKTQGRIDAEPTD